MGSTENTGPFQLALFGLGRAGRIHFTNITHNTRCAVKYVVEADGKAAKTFLIEARAQDVTVVSPEEAQLVYDDTSVQGVIVASPTFTHEGIITAALQHGKGVFTEKPLSDTVEGVRKCYDLADEVNRPLMCSFNRRWDPSILEVRNRVKSGELGKLHMIKTCSRDHPLPTTAYLGISGGIFHDCAVHDLDYVCWIAGEFPVSVYVQGTAQNDEIRQMGDVDTALIILKFASGLLGLLDIGRHSTYGYDQRLEINGSEGMMINENPTPSSVVKHSKAGVQGTSAKYSFPQRYSDSYINVIDHFCDVLEDKAKPGLTKKDVVNVCLMASACDESHKTGLPVNLSYS